jgi:hypothetical protein
MDKRLPGFRRGASQGIMYRDTKSPAIKSPGTLYQERNY